ncbi:uncharacterized protein LOC129591152 [Paramacrobiotus metropolitanus]|uniref:uncharacterized protein LOC129591152 n=1 Tax=Paramacrobiotus metropolitanus TaxID=2943436 RepID=UPI002445B9EE|nr:uncharacterized protein LOC129591152 [Paramacrobiotus metropolitanus]
MNIILCFVVLVWSLMDSALAGLSVDLANIPMKTRVPIKDPNLQVSEAVSINLLAGAGSDSSNEVVHPRAAIAVAPVIPTLDANLPKIPVPNFRPCSCEATVRTTPSPSTINVPPRNRLALEPSIRGMQAGHPRGAPPRTAIKPIPGKGVHCSLLFQNTSGLDCPCQNWGERCGPPRSICSNFSSEFSTCMCNLAESVREGTKCQPAAVSIPARGADFRIFAPAPVVEVGCDAEPCQIVSGINTLMGVPPYSWTINRIHSTGSNSILPDDSPGPDISLDDNANILNGANCLRSGRGLTVDLDKVSAHRDRLGPVERIKDFFTGRQLPIAALTSSRMEKQSKVDVYRIVARDGDGTVSNMVTLTVFFNNQCPVKIRTVSKDV